MPLHALPCLTQERHHCRGRMLLSVEPGLTKYLTSAISAISADNTIASTSSDGNDRNVRNENGNDTNDREAQDELNMWESPLQESPTAPAATTAPREREIGDSKYSWACSFNSNKKMEPLSFAVWMAVLQQVPTALLVLLDVEDYPKKNLMQQALFHGISPDRLVFVQNAPWEDHLHRLASCDIILDTFTYGAHTTASDGLWMWVPVLSLEGWGSQRMPSRVAASITESVLGEKWTSVGVFQNVRQ